jgi:hypothetical protein
MTRTERQDLLQICRQRERVAKAEAVAVAARILPYSPPWDREITRKL